MNALNIWSNHTFSPELQAAIEAQVRPHVMQWSKEKASSVLMQAARDTFLRDRAVVAWGQPSVEDLLEARALRWVQLSSASFTRYDREDVREHCRRSGLIVSNASSLYDEPCAQHALALMLAVARSLPAAHENQLGERGWPYAALRRSSRLLGPRSQVLLVGYGAIARRLVALLAPFGVQPLAFRRQVRGDENCRTLPIEALDTHLPQADFVVNILPSSPATRGFFDAERLARLPESAVFCNLGRGDTVETEALGALLEQGRLHAAALDVTDPEPLPPQHPLWREPRCLITPHTAGGTADEPQRQIDHFLAALRRYERGEPVADRIF